MQRLLKYLTPTTHTPQTEPIPNAGQVRNNAGGYGWAVSPWEQLRRFLVLGSEGGTYYVSERKLTLDNAQNVLACLSEDGPRAVREIVAVSDGGRAPKNTPAIFALAMAASVEDAATRQAALESLPKVCRTATHLFEFVEAVQTMRGWGRALRRGVAAWYTGQTSRNLAYQLVKYRQRNGWTHADTLRLAHPVPADDLQDRLFKWATDRESVEWDALHPPGSEALDYVWAFERAQATTDIPTLVQLITQYDLTREALPTHALKSPEVWAALLEKMPMTAMIRNLGVMSRVGLLKEFSAVETTIVERLTNADYLRKARIHPIAVLTALKAYGLGYPLAGGNLHYRRRIQDEDTWIPSARVLDALDTAFELAFHNITPANKRIMLALDVSGSMVGSQIAASPGLDAATGSAAMALVTARTEPTYSVMAFSNEFMRLKITAKMHLADALKATSGLPFKGTDCALPMIYASQHKLEVDQFVIYTDSETWAGKIHPTEALRDYRQQSGIDARVVVVGMVSNGFSIADPNDKGMLDVVGFDASAPQVISDFARGEI